MAKLISENAIDKIAEITKGEYFDVSLHNFLSPYDREDIIVFSHPKQNILIRINKNNPSKSSIEGKIQMNWVYPILKIIQEELNGNKTRVNKATTTLT